GLNKINQAIAGHMLPNFEILNTTLDENRIKMGQSALAGQRVDATNFALIGGTRQYGEELARVAGQLKNGQRVTIQTTSGLTELAFVSRKVQKQSALTSGAITVVGQSTGRMAGIVRGATGIVNTFAFALKGLFTTAGGLLFITQILASFAFPVLISRISKGKKEISTFSESMSAVTDRSADFAKTSGNLFTSLVRAQSQMQLLNEQLSSVAEGSLKELTILNSMQKTFNTIKN